MNDRIKELATQAGFIPENGPELYESVVEKFAELIIRECARIAGDNFNSGFVDEIIREHFGVE